jgi:hypothetical protein
MTTLIGRNRYSLSIFLDGTVYNLLHGAVVTQMDHLTAGRLYDPSHDVDRCIVSIEKGRSSYDSDVIFGFIYLYSLGHVVSKFWVNKFTENEEELEGFGFNGN